MVQQIPQADRITTNMFGGKIGRNELLAIYLAFTVGGYFDRKRISSRNQASDKAKGKSPTSLHQRVQLMV